ncbi:MAG: hypothetical protein C5B55_11560 [Blastocatellia bacterium]|nr:MAG: hypothetical protein C5B55_11560 [Blastocatellia bacterium]
MKRVVVILAATFVPVLFAVTVVSFAQQQRVASGDGSIVVQRHIIQQGPEGAPPPPPPADFVFIASEVGFGGKVVKGAPYSAQAVTETVQTLSDGNRIINKISSTVYRDSEGRTRREQTLKGLGNLGDAGEPIQTIFIHDPVAGVSYTLDTRSHIARKSLPFTLALPGPPDGAPDTRKFEYRVEPMGQAPSGVVVTKKAPVVIAGNAQGEVAPAQAENGQLIVKTEGGVSASTTTYVFKRTDGPDPNAVTEKLGTQIIEGVQAEGTKTTITIPAGEIGNERPIEIVSERWYSPELQAVVMTRHSDPRTGETTYKLTNINRTEPAKSLFEVPGEYTIKDMPGPPGAGVIAPGKIRKPGNPE